jgi:hypothetical protein
LGEDSIMRMRSLTALLSSALYLIPILSLPVAAQGPPGGGKGPPKVAPRVQAKTVHTKRPVARHVPVKKQTTKITTQHKKSPAVVHKQPLVKKNNNVALPKGPKGGGLPLAKTKGPVVPVGTGKALPAKGLNFAGKPLIRPPAQGLKFKQGRLALPQNIKPKVSLLKPPPPVFQKKFGPFVQRHWKSAFFWSFIAGIGYVTVPDIYYDRWVVLTNGPDPDYDGCVTLLNSYAVTESDYERAPVPANVSYRYSAPVAPQAAALNTCKFDPFVERRWDKSFVWVQIPEVGNVTVPEDHYERFFQYVSANPADYPSACNVLVEAAATDSVVGEAWEQ